MGLFQLIGKGAQNQADQAIGFLKGAVSTVGNVGEAADKILAPTVGRLGSTLSSMVTGKKKTPPKPVQKGAYEQGLSRLGIKNAATPTNFNQKLGFGLEKVAEVLAPSTFPTKAGIAVKGAMGASKLARPLGKAVEIGLEGGISGATAFAQTGDKKTARNAAIIGSMGVPIASAVARGIGFVTKEVAKTISSTMSGVPQEAIEQALNNPRAVQTAIKQAAESGEFAEREILDRVTTSFDELLDARRVAFREGLEKVPSEVAEKLSLDGVKTAAKKTLSEFNIRYTDNGLDFAKSALPKSYNKELQEVIERIDGWDDLSPKGVDDLREIIDGYKKGGVNPDSATKKFNAIVKSLRGEITEYINKEVPEVADLNRAYAQQSDVIDRIKDEVLNGKEGTRLRKIMNVFSPKSPIYREVITELGEKTGKDFLSDISGALLAKWTPEGLGKYLTTMLGSGATAGAVVTGGLLPGAATIGATAAASSPRIIGGVATTVGKIGQSGMANAIRTAAQQYKIPISNAVAQFLGQIEEREKSEANASPSSVDTSQYPPQYSEFIKKAIEAGYSEEDISVFLQQRSQNQR